MRAWSLPASTTSQLLSGSGLEWVSTSTFDGNTDYNVADYARVNYTAASSIPNHIEGSLAYAMRLDNREDSVTIYHQAMEIDLLPFEGVPLKFELDLDVDTTEVRANTTQHRTIQHGVYMVSGTINTSSLTYTQDQHLSLGNDQTIDVTAHVTPTNIDMTAIGGTIHAHIPDYTGLSVYTSPNGTFTYVDAAPLNGNTGINFNVQNYNGTSCSGSPTNGDEASTVFTNFQTTVSHRCVHLTADSSVQYNFCDMSRGAILLHLLL